jgi:hypothetical protein
MSHLIVPHNQYVRMLLETMDQIMIVVVNVIRAEAIARMILNLSVFQ